MTSQRQPAESIGLIGLGLLGSALAERLLSSGFEVVGFDIAAERRREFASNRLQPGIGLSLK